MPKKNDQIVCVNHTDQILREETLVALRMMEEVNSTLQYKNDGYVVSLFRCPQCGYIEFYGVVKLDPNSNNR